MRCAHCKSRDVDIAHIKQCSGVDFGAVEFNDRLSSAKFNEDIGLREVKEDGPMWPPSEPQVQYVVGLQQSRTLPAEYVTKDEAQIRLMEKDEVSRLIGELKAMPYQAPTGRGQSTTTVLAGRYAIYKPGVDDEPGAYSYVDRQDLNPPSRGYWMFYQVDKPTEGRWKGYTFTKRLQGAPGSYKQIRLPRDEANRVLEVIAKDPKKAMLDYGLQSGVCGRCSSPLTNKESLDRGIGPVCAGKLGW